MILVPLLALVLGVAHPQPLEILMTLATLEQAGASPMQGPDFEFGYVRDFEESSEETVVALRHGSVWRLKRLARNYQASLDIATHVHSANMPIFISGDRRTGLIDRVAMPKAWKVLSVTADERGNRVLVMFRGPPSIYFVSLRRHWADEALYTLKQNILSPETALWVSTDIRTGEIMDVRPM